MIEVQNFQGTPSGGALDADPTADHCLCTCTCNCQCPPDGSGFVAGNPNERMERAYVPADVGLPGIK